jgi:putative radical SAM enzyme (TIGR03279 family)
LEQRGQRSPLFSYKEKRVYPLITGVEKKSPAHKAGLRIGDRLVSICGNEIRDVLDYKYHSENSRLTLEIEREGKRLGFKIKKEESEPLGLEFESYLMDNARSCANKCIFCFIDQLPKGLRDTLYFKDDDARLSFLTGNYITFTNLSKRELQRIKELRISPINVSVQATDPELRCKMLGNKNAGSCLELMTELARAGIEMNCQIVVCPGYNDGEQLIKSMQDLSGLYPQVSSVSVVPVGLTRYREGLTELEPVTAEKAAEIIRAVYSFGEDCLRTLGSRLFYCGDELYLKAGIELPDWEYYEGFPQFENGVGMLRSLEDEFIAALEDIDCPSQSEVNSFSVATGLAAAPLLSKLLQIAADRCYNISGRVYSIENRFFGSSVDVAGLITGQDLIDQLKGKPLGSRLLISANMLRHGGDMFLDSVTLTEASKELGIPIIPVVNDGAELLKAFMK